MNEKFIDVKLFGADEQLKMKSKPDGGQREWEKRKV